MCFSVRYMFCVYSAQTFYNKLGSILFQIEATSCEH